MGKREQKVKINTFEDLEKCFNSYEDPVSMHDMALENIEFKDNSVILDIGLGEVHALRQWPWFENIWKDPKKDRMYLRLTFDNIKILYSDNIIKALEIATIWVENSITETERKRQKYHFIPIDADMDDQYELIFDYDSFRWEVLGLSADYTKLNMR